MTAEATGQNRTCHYFVDEAGDGTLFNKKKQTVVGSESCSKYFMLGVLEVIDPEKFDQELNALRANLLAEPYLASIPSMQPEHKKTAIQFHAKDDCVEVRREVFKLLVHHDLKFFAVIRDKRVISEKVKAFNVKQPLYRYHPNQLYDRCVSHLFRDRLHREEGYLIHFSKRGNKNQTAALETALEQARKNFRAKWKTQVNRPIEVTASQPRNFSGLQAVDYFLWALQRLYERDETRYWEFVANQVHFVHDVDDTRNSKDGAFYSNENPLDLDKRKK